VTKNFSDQILTFLHPTNTFPWLFLPQPKLFLDFFFIQCQIIFSFNLFFTTYFFNNIMNSVFLNTKIKSYKKSFQPNELLTLWFSYFSVSSIRFLRNNCYLLNYHDFFWHVENIYSGKMWLISKFSRGKVTNFQN